MRVYELVSISVPKFRVPNALTKDANIEVDESDKKGAKECWGIPTEVEILEGVRLPLTWV